MKYRILLVLAVISHLVNAKTKVPYHNFPKYYITTEFRYNRLTSHTEIPVTETEALTELPKNFGFGVSLGRRFRFSKWIGSELELSYKRDIRKYGKITVNNIEKDLHIYTYNHAVISFYLQILRPILEKHIFFTSLGAGFNITRVIDKGASAYSSFKPNRIHPSLTMESGFDLPLSDSYQISLSIFYTLSSPVKYIDYIDLPLNGLVYSETSRTVGFKLRFFTATNRE